MTNAYGLEDRIEVIPAIPRHSARILDVGCGSGLFGETLSRHFPHARAEAVEPDRELASVAKRRYQVVYNSPFDEVRTTLSNYDCVIFNDVLEHLVDPWATLVDTRSLLLPHGRVVASIPNIRYLPISSSLLLGGRWDYTERGTLDRTHLRFFTHKTIVDMFEESGYEVLDIWGINPASGRRWSWLKYMPKAFDGVRWLQYVVSASPVP